MSRASRFHLVLVAALALLAPASSQAQWDVSADFTNAANPNGAWSYGYRTFGNLNAASLSFYALSGNSGGLDYWSSNTQLTPGVFRNVLPAPTTNFGTVTLAAGQLAMHPGPGGEFSVIRWTAPSSGVYSLASQFIGVDCCTTTTDVHVLLDGASLFLGAVSGYGNSASYSSGNLSLVGGDVLEFVVGYGANGNYYYDSTGLAATITSVTATPEPASLALFATGLVGLGGMLKRRRPTR